ncbi:hypothetical protein D3C77_417620 [compost metagenome]
MRVTTAELIYLVGVVAARVDHHQADVQHLPGHLDELTGELLMQPLPNLGAVQVAIEALIVQHP